MRVGASGRRVILDGLYEFQEHLGGELAIPLLGGIGHEVTVHEIREDRLLNAMEWLHGHVGP